MYDDVLTQTEGHNCLVHDNPEEEGEEHVGRVEDGGVIVEADCGGPAVGGGDASSIAKGAHCGVRCRRTDIANIRGAFAAQGQHAHGQLDHDCQRSADLNRA